MYSDRGQTVRFAYGTSLRVEGKTNDVLLIQRHCRRRKWDSKLRSTAAGNSVYSADNDCYPSHPSDLPAVFLQPTSNAHNRPGYYNGHNCSVRSYEFVFFRTVSKTVKWGCVI